MSLLLDFIFPRHCYGCRKSGFYLCPDCQKKLFPQPIKVIDKKLFDGSLSIYKYSGLIKNIIHDLKYNFVSDLSSGLSTLIVDELKSNYPNLLKYWQNNKFTLIPIPLHPLRQNWRGFNQSELICRHLSSQLQLKYDINLLFRSVNTAPQVKNENPKDRQSNLSGVFYLNETISYSANNFIIFDDVATTFSTLKSAGLTFVGQKNAKLWTLTVAG